MRNNRVGINENDFAALLNGSNMGLTSDVIIENKKLKDDLESLRYHTFAHALYQFEKQTGQKREDIREIWYDGGNGWIMCSIRVKEGPDHYISDELVAALLLDWAKANNKLVEWKERR